MLQYMPLSHPGYVFCHPSAFHLPTLTVITTITGIGFHCTVPNMLLERDVPNTGIYCSSDKVRTVYLVEYCHVTTECPDERYPK
jgi:hypothetical protein